MREISWIKSEHDMTRKREKMDTKLPNLLCKFKNTQIELKLKKTRIAKKIIILLGVIFSLLGHFSPLPTPLPSTSSMFYTHVFRTKFWRQKSQSQMYLEKSCSICFRTKNARLKCLWNWPLVVNITRTKLKVTKLFEAWHHLWTTSNEKHFSFKI